MVTFYFKYSLINCLRKIPRVFSMKVKNNSSTKMTEGGNEDNYNSSISNGNEMKEKIEN